MITLWISRGYVTGATEALMFWLACTVLYAAGCFAFRANRNAGGPGPVAWGFLTAELAVDLLWCLTLYGPQGYVNHGVGSAFLIVLWPLALLVTALVVTTKNTARRKETDQHGKGASHG